MSRINTNVSSLVAQRVLARNNAQLNTSLERLSTGLKINSGADNPAGLIASENLRAEKTGLTAAMSNAERAGNIIATAEGGLAEVGNLLNELQGLVTETANSGGLTQDEIDANQLQVDSILGTINRLAGSVNFQGKKLLNGEMEYFVSGATTSTLADVSVNSARLVGGGAQALNVTVVSAAETALVTQAIANTSGVYKLEIAGNNGAEEITLASNATAADVVTAVNNLKDVTGVSATASGTTVLYNSQGYGSNSFVTVKGVEGVTFTGNDEGTDVNVNVNGVKAEADGLNVTVRNNLVDATFTLDSSTATNVAAYTKTINITGGGATFSLGAKATQADQASIGINSVSTGSLGTSGSKLSSLGSGGTNSLTSGNISEAQKALTSAIKQVSETRGRLGSFQKFVIGSTVNQLGVAFENASAAESAIRDADFAQETAALTRGQILAQASTTVLAQANQQPQRVLALLG